MCNFEYFFIITFTVCCDNVSIIQGLMMKTLKGHSIDILALAQPSQKFGKSWKIGKSTSVSKYCSRDKHHVSKLIL